jgi:hypothetical protein
VVPRTRACRPSLIALPNPFPIPPLSEQQIDEGGGSPVDGDVLAEALPGVDTLPSKKSTAAFASGGSHTPRAATHTLPSKQRSQFGPQIDSNKRNSYAFGFGTASRFDFDKKKQPELVYPGGHRRKKPLPYTVPGPGYYDAGSAIGTQEYSEKRSYPSFGFAKSDRFAQDAREQKQLMGVPAPGTYVLPPSVGHQPSSTKESLPVVSFGLAHRDVKVSIGKGYEVGPWPSPPYYPAVCRTFYPPALSAGGRRLQRRRRQPFSLLS